MECASRNFSKGVAGTVVQAHHEQSCHAECAEVCEAQSSTIEIAIFKAQNLRMKRQGYPLKQCAVVSLKSSGGTRAAHETCLLVLDLQRREFKEDILKVACHYARNVAYLSECAGRK